MAIKADTLVVQDYDGICSVVDEQVIMLNVRTGSYFTLNRIGSEIWQMLAEPRRVSEIFDALSRLHDVEQITMSRDVVAFLEAMINHRLLRVVDCGPT